MAEKVINEEEINVAQPWRGAMKRQVHNIIVSTLEASETMLEERDPDSDPEEQYIELMAIALNAVAAMGGVSKTSWRWQRARLRSISTERKRTMASKQSAQRQSRSGLQVAPLVFFEKAAGR
jgi:hypothetical protein